MGANLHRGRHFWTCGVFPGISPGELTVSFDLALCFLTSRVSRHQILPLFTKGCLLRIFPLPSTSPPSHILLGDTLLSPWSQKRRLAMSFFFFKLINLFILLYNIVLVLPYIDLNPPWVYMYVFPILNLLPLPSHPIPLGHPSAPARSILYHASNLDWRFISHMIIYMFQCHSPISSCPRPPPQSPKGCSIHLCLFCCLAYKVIVTIFLNSVYMH